MSIDCTSCAVSLFSSFCCRSVSFSEAFGKKWNSHPKRKMPRIWETLEARKRFGKLFFDFFEGFSKEIGFFGEGWGWEKTILTEKRKMEKKRAQREIGLGEDFLGVVEDGFEDGKEDWELGFHRNSLIKANTKATMTPPWAIIILIIHLRRSDLIDSTSARVFSREVSMSAWGSQSQGFDVVFEACDA